MLTYKIEWEHQKQKFDSDDEYYKSQYKNIPTAKQVYCNIINSIDLNDVVLRQLSILYQRVSEFLQQFRNIKVEYGNIVIIPSISLSIEQINNIMLFPEKIPAIINELVSIVNNTYSGSIDDIRIGSISPTKIHIPPKPKLQNPANYADIDEIYSSMVEYLIQTEKKYIQLTSDVNSIIDQLQLLIK